jgi:hypothetical protein
MVNVVPLFAKTQMFVVCATRTRTSFPQLYVNGKFVGGSDIVYHHPLPATVMSQTHTPSTRTTFEEKALLYL